MTEIRYGAEDCGHNNWSAWMRASESPPRVRAIVGEALREGVEPEARICQYPRCFALQVRTRSGRTSIGFTEHAPEPPLG